ncbi:universal stress protein [Deinococcus arcticus]|uniref:UspA domain-containing protein n=1 Tax=Deinococcus arcticus TaxID=2136176 RepID=A0A2T3W396_9DEIO|nr:universal stress protein [Deinococcus arcticus]PTA66347.1 hypothetical protein C8263_18390 [Deinococcus arcticus]
MYRHILVLATDHPASAHAAQQAHRLTRALGGRVTLLRVLATGGTSQRAAALAQLQALAAGARRAPGVAVLVLEPPGAEPAPAIAAFATRSGADLIVLGLGGTGSPADDAQGALALALAVLSGVPVQLAAAPSPARVGGPPWLRVVEEAGPSRSAQRLGGQKSS